MSVAWYVYASRKGLLRFLITLFKVRHVFLGPCCEKDDTVCLPAISGIPLLLLLAQRASSTHLLSSIDLPVPNSTVA